MTKDGCPAGEKLLGLVRDALDDGASSRVRAHVSSCEACRERAAGLEELVGLLERAATEPLPDDLEPSRAACPDPELVAAYADGSSDEHASALVERHLAGCASCLAEVADLWRLSSAGSPVDAPDRAVSAAIARLESEARTAIVRWAGATVSVVKDFARSQAEALEGAGRGAHELAPAFARGSDEAVLLSWRGDDDLLLEGRIDIRGGGRPALTGRLTRLGSPDLSLSAAMSGDGERHGPESLDSDGRFGPWALARGQNTLRVTGRTVGERGLSLTIEITEDNAEDPTEIPAE
jgi:anti-sigma factor RsiW